MFFGVLVLVWHTRPVFHSFLDAQDTSGGGNHVFRKVVEHDAWDADIEWTQTFHADSDGFADARSEPREMFKSIVGEVFVAHDVAVVDAHAKFYARNEREMVFEGGSNRVGDFPSAIDGVFAVGIVARQDN